MERIKWVLGKHSESSSGLQNIDPLTIYITWEMGQFFYYYHFLFWDSLWTYWQNFHCCLWGQGFTPVTWNILGGEVPFKYEAVATPSARLQGRPFKRREPTTTSELTAAKSISPGGGVECGVLAAAVQPSKPKVSSSNPSSETLFHSKLRDRHCQTAVTTYSRADV